MASSNQSSDGPVLPFVVGSDDKDIRENVVSVRCVKQRSVVTWICEVVLLFFVVDLQQSILNGWLDVLSYFTCLLNISTMIGAARASTTTSCPSSETCRRWKEVRSLLERLGVCGWEGNSASKPWQQGDRQESPERLPGRGSSWWNACQKWSNTISGSFGQIYFEWRAWAKCYRLCVALPAYA